MRATAARRGGHGTLAESMIIRPLSQLYAHSSRAMSSNEDTGGESHSKVITRCDSCLI